MPLHFPWILYILFAILSIFILNRSLVYPMLFDIPVTVLYSVIIIIHISVLYSFKFTLVNILIYGIA